MDLLRVSLKGFLKGINRGGRPTPTVANTIPWAGVPDKMNRRRGEAGVMAHSEWTKHSLAVQVGGPAFRASALT